ncbi:MAG: DUF2066 domain-containing protein [Wenzhouxiangella sp.]|nr:DUF2066 domain-containing protein [Wenzhouxiangella sp.]
MLRLIVQVLVVTAALCAAASVDARDLYTGESVLEESVSGQSDPLARALDEVLARLTGYTDQSLVERLGLTRADLQLLVLSQQRVRRERLAPDGVTPVEQLRLRVDFDPAGVDALLAGASLPRLGRTRPSILLWLAVEDEQGLSLDGDARLNEAIAMHARRLGLDVLRPLGDLQDLSEIEAIDIRGGFLGAAEPGAERYGAGMIAMLDLREAGQEWTGRWFWRLEGRDAGLQARADLPEVVVAEGLEALLRALVDRFGHIAGADQGGMVRLVVEGIEDEIQYAEALRYLDSLGQVDAVQVVAASGRNIDFELMLSSAGLEDALMIGGVLDVVERRRDGSLRVRLKR